MKKLLRILLSQTVIIGLLAVVQIGVYVVLFSYFSRIGTFTYTVITIGAVLLVVMMLEKNDINPAYKMMWVLLTVTMPLPGTLFYLWWGNRRLGRKKATLLAETERRAALALQQDPELIEKVRAMDPTLIRGVQYLSDVAKAPVYHQTQGTYFPMGQDFFVSFLEEAERAQKYIFMEYFIIEEGEMWDTTLALLKRKAAAGLDVRVLYDSFGCMATLPAKYEEQLRKAGIKCFLFNPAMFSWHISDYKMLNHRDHRKIAVIDGEVGFSGGLNFADEYINAKQRFGVWKDTGFRLKGPGVYSLTVMFLKMWDFVTGSTTHYTQYMPQGRYEADGYVQPYGDSPLDAENVAESAYFNVLQRAERYVYVATPYLVIDHEMVTSLCLAAKSGIDVRIITPGIPDKWYVYYVTQSFYPELLRAGVRIYEYTPGFLHAKMYVSDDKVAIVGSANMDYRSLYLHFENCCTFYGGHMVTDVKRDLDETLRQSHEVTLENTRELSLFKFFAQIFLRFFAPMM